MLAATQTLSLFAVTGAKMYIFLLDIAGVCVL
jgi:hypothetical protein